MYKIRHCVAVCEGNESEYDTCHLSVQHWMLWCKIVMGTPLAKKYPDWVELLLFNFIKFIFEKLYFLFYK